MTTPEAVPYRPESFPFGRRWAARFAVGCAHLLATQPPGRICTVLRWLRRGARPTSLRQATAARDTVLAVSLSCGGQKGCLPRSLGTVLLCRMRGEWAVWCVGARKRPPFAAHAWVEAEGELVGEGCPVDYYQRFLSVE
ncbi:lasso peptide biosynthesis B2 protein [Streptomyces sp. NPDC048506]|uniref:lasso peptide biosynthesis B2 protein n=1 Tax=Streptomyces sp. NPDC048506 TaxID=3155028 RepID=UPI0034188D31